MFHLVSAQHIANKCWDTYWRTIQTLLINQSSDSLVKMNEAWANFQKSLSDAGVISTLQGYKFKC